MNPTNPLFGSNRMKLGIFSTNGKGASQTLVPEAYRATWALSVETAQLADRTGYEAIVPYARWKGYVDGKNTHPSGVVMDPFTWAAGIAQATSRAAIFATSHAPTIHPLVAAKQSATVDLISGGRFALNVVGGWNKPELEMFGAPLKEYDQRYDHLAEWLAIVERLWTDDNEFDFDGAFFKIVGGMSLPKPLQQPRPPIMNAGGSDRGRRFACGRRDFGGQRRRRVGPARPVFVQKTDRQALLGNPLIPGRKGPESSLQIHSPPPPRGAPPPGLSHPHLRFA